MSTNLRLGDELAAALRNAAAQRGQSQQAIVREALVKELGLGSGLTAMQRSVRAGVVTEPEPFRDVEPALILPAGISSLDLLERVER